jgi:hypothetical protein
MWSGLVLRNHGALSAVTVDEVNLSFAESRTRRLPVGEGAGVDTFVRTSAIERCHSSSAHRGTRQHRFP